MSNKKNKYRNIKNNETKNKKDNQIEVLDETIKIDTMKDNASSKEVKKISQQPKRKKKKRQASAFNIVMIGFMVIFMIIYLVLPKVYIICTGEYDTGSSKQKKFAKETYGEYGELDYKLYYDWYYVVKETGKGLILFAGDDKLSEFEMDDLANKFAVAYWKEYGEEGQLKKLETFVDFAMKNLENPEPNSKNLAKWMNKYYHKKETRKSYNDYAFFELNSTKKALTEQEKLNLADVVKEITGKKVKVVPKELKYKTIDKVTSDEIIKDTRKIIKEWGFDYPTIVHLFVKSPTNHYTTTLKKATLLLFLEIEGFILVLYLVGNMVRIIVEYLKNKFDSKEEVI